ncbi:MAG: hypothetical protein GXP30_14715 [Verrucomicrobia bacterium]|nr:hypothetical protein [Verrucomicrobiota bacterium]
MHRFEELLAGLVDGECGMEARSELAELCAGSPERCRMVMDRLSFSELLRQACVSEKEGESFESLLVEKLGMVGDGFEAEVTRLLFGEDQGEWIESIRKQPVLAERLRAELEFDDLIAQAVSESKSEEAFVQALSTRMWAEVEEDHFVEDLASKIIELDTTRSNRIVSISLSDNINREVAPEMNWWTSSWRPAMALAAAVALTAVMLWDFFPSSEVGRMVAESGNTIWDASYGKVPEADGGLSKGVYRLASGVVHLRFDEGAEMSLEGPAEFEIKGKREVEIFSGLVVAREQRGNRRDFIIGAQGMDLACGGSTVGLDVRDGAAPELIVLNGGAGVSLTVGGVNRRLYDFEAVRADLGRDKLVDIPFNSRPFSKAWELMSGVEANTGTVEVVVPGSRSRHAAEDNRVRVTVERDQFKLADHEHLEVDTLSRGRFVSLRANQKGEVLAERGELRSYLLELKPGGKGSAESTLEASMTFDHPVVGVIFSEGRLVNSNGLLGANSEVENEPMGQGRVLLSDDGRTVNLVLSTLGDKPLTGMVRVLVALN